MDVEYEDFESKMVDLAEKQEWALEQDEGMTTNIFILGEFAAIQCEIDELKEMMRKILE